MRESGNRVFSISREKFCRTKPERRGMGTSEDFGEAPGLNSTAIVNTVAQVLQKIAAMLAPAAKAA